MIWGLGSIISTVVSFLFIILCFWIAISILENFFYIILILAGVVFPLLCLIVGAGGMAGTPIWFDWPYRTNLILTIASSCWFGVLILGGLLWFVITIILEYIEERKERRYFMAEIYENSKKFYSSENNEKNLNNNVGNNNKKNKKHKLNLSIEVMKKYDNFFANSIIGQDFAISKIKEQLISLLYDVDENSNRPAGVFFFAGPTGVGKTETCKILSKFLYNNVDINRFDMSEYKDEFAAINKLIGASNGLVGYEEGGTLINAMQENPNAIVLFDEIEKADKSVFDLFLQIIDEGYVTSNKGEKIKFKNNIIIFTSNLGSSKISMKNSHDENNKIINDHIYDFFNNKINRPEILGRIGKENIISFNLINNSEDIFKILDIYFDNFIKNMSNKKAKLIFNKYELYGFILKDLDVTKGARDIRNNFDNFKKNLTKLLFEKGIGINDLKNKNIEISCSNNDLNINIYDANLVKSIAQ